MKDKFDNGTLNPLYKLKDLVSEKNEKGKRTSLEVFNDTYPMESKFRDKSKYLQQQLLAQFLADRVADQSKVNSIILNNQDNMYSPHNRQMHLNFTKGNLATTLAHESTHALDHSNMNIYQNNTLKYLAKLEELIGKPLEDEHIGPLFNGASSIVSKPEFRNLYPYQDKTRKGIKWENSFLRDIENSFVDLDPYTQSAMSKGINLLAPIGKGSKLSDRIRASHNIDHLKSIKTEANTPPEVMNFRKSYNLLKALQNGSLNSQNLDQKQLPKNWNLDNTLPFFQFSELTAHPVEHLYDDWNINSKEANEGSKDFLHYILGKTRKKFTQLGMSRDDYPAIDDAFEQKLNLLKPPRSNSPQTMSGGLHQTLSPRLNPFEVKLTDTQRSYINSELPHGYSLKRLEEGVRPLGNTYSQGDSREWDSKTSNPSLQLVPNPLMQPVTLNPQQNTFSTMSGGYPSMGINYNSSNNPTFSQMTLGTQPSKQLPPDLMQAESDDEGHMSGSELRKIVKPDSLAPNQFGPNEKPKGLRNGGYIEPSSGYSRYNRDQEYNMLVNYLQRYLR